MEQKITINNINFSETTPEKQQYLALHATTGWNAQRLFTHDQLYEAICNSWYSIAAYNDQQLIGFGRIISDGIYQTFICDVMVHPNYQAQGVGKNIMHALLQHCEQKGIKWVQLFCAKGKHSFYEKLGFTSRDVDAPGMTLFLNK